MDAPTRYEFMHQAGAVKSEDGRFVLAAEHTRLMVEKDAEIAELEEALEAARRDAFEEAAKVAEPIIQKWVDFEPPYDGSLDDAIDLIQGLPAAIRALAEKG